MDQSEFNTRGVCADCKTEDMLRPQINNGRRSTMRCLPCTELFNMRAAEARRAADAYRDQCVKELNRRHNSREWPWSR